MHRVGSGFPGRRDQPVNREIALRRRGGPDGDGVIGGANVGGSPVGRRVHRDRLEPFFMACTDDSESDFAAVRDQDAF